MKFTLSGVLAILVLVAPLEAWGAYNDVTLTTDTVLSVGGITVNVSGSSAAVESITVGASSFNVTLLPSSTITVTSANREELNVSTEAYTTAYSCNSLTLAGSGPSAVVTVTPDSTDICSTVSGGGGGGTKKITPVKVTPTPSTPLQPAKPVVPVVQGSAVFTTNLSLGMTSPDVTRLQTLLAGRVDLYPQGTVSGYFGPLTARAVERFQVAYGVASAGQPGYGSVGPKTREKLQQVFSTATGATPVVAAPVPAAVSNALFTRDLQKNSSGADVKQLQVILNSNVATQIAASGTGSPGNETDYFGLLTEKAVQKFQEKYGIAVSGDSGYGIVGPKTRAKLTEIASKK